jgi:hypothetical protein
LIPPLLARIRREREESLRQAVRIKDLQAQLDRPRPGPGKSSGTAPSRPERNHRHPLVRRVGRKLPSAVRRRVPASIRAWAGGTQP